MGKELLLPFSVIIPTRNRWDTLWRTLRSIAEQSVWPGEIIVVDASDENGIIEQDLNFLTLRGITYVRIKAETKGAAVQRSEGLQVARFDLVCFMDDDILLQPDCLKNLYGGITSIELAGGVNALITNQQYVSPGFLTSMMYRMMNGAKLSSYAGKVLGPAWNILPGDDPGLPDYVPCEWLNTTCVMYKRSFLPSPLFDPFFRGYSFMEDVALSIEVGKKAQLFNARLARIYHDSKGGSHKSNLIALSEMMLVNRYWVMTQSLNRTGIVYVLKLIMLEVFGVVTSLRSRSGWYNFPAAVVGKSIGLLRIGLGIRKSMPR